MAKRKISTKAIVTNTADGVVGSFYEFEKALKDNDFACCPIKITYEKLPKSDHYYKSAKRKTITDFGS